MLQGQGGGRPIGSYDKVKAAAAATLYQKETPISQICGTLKISRSTLDEYLKKEGVEYNGFKKIDKNDFLLLHIFNTLVLTYLDILMNSLQKSKNFL